MREKEITDTLNHPNIVRLEGYFHDSDYCYFLFELCSLGNLRELISNFRTLSLKLTRFYTMEIINALVYLRDNNIVHRDLKPQNLLLDDTLHIKICDFGAAKKYDPEEVEKLISEDMELMDENTEAKDSDSSDSDFEQEMLQKMKIRREKSKQRVSNSISTIEYSDRDSPLLEPGDVDGQLGLLQFRSLGIGFDHLRMPDRRPHLQRQGKVGDRGFHQEQRYSNDGRP